MEIVMRPVAELKGYKKNARTHSQAQIEELVNSIKTYGFLDPIEIGADMVVISGHARLAAALQLKLTHVPTILHAGIDKVARKGYILAANRIAQSAGWDSSLVQDQLLELKDDGFDLRLTGFSQDEIDDYLNPEILKDGLTDENDCEGGSGKSRVTMEGDIWKLGEHRLMCGDSTSADNVAELMDDETVDMVFTDPPYGIDEVTDRSSRNGSKRRLGHSNSFDKIIGDETITAAIGAYNLCESLDIPLMVFWGANHYCHALPQSANWLVWDKREEDKQRDNNSDCELAWVKSKAKSVRIFRHLWKGLIKASENGEARVHPTQKPVALAEWCFEEYGSKAKTILDLFGGSGSTLIACEKTGRKCYIMEIDPGYCDIIVRRWMKFTGKVAVLEATGEPFHG